MNESRRHRARTLADQARAQGDALGWFERLYREATAGEATVPRADLVPNPQLVAWLDGNGKRWSRALVVGCGYGDDAEHIAASGVPDVVAFDIAETAVARARERFPRSPVTYVVADALDPPSSWRGAFDLVVEINTLQVLPPELRAPLAERLAECVVPGGTMLIVSRGREDSEPEGRLPWPLTRTEVCLPTRFGLSCEAFEDMVDDETPPVRRFVGAFRAPRGAPTGSVRAVHRRAGHGVGKDTQESIDVVAGMGVVGDAHFGETVQHRSRVAADPSQPNLRQVHLLHTELLDELANAGFAVGPGTMGENITTVGVDLLGLPRGTVLRIGDDAMIEITGLRNPCAQLNEIADGLMAATLERAPDGSLIRKAGVMGIVITGGPIRAGDPIRVALPSPPHLRLERV